MRVQREVLSLAKGCARGNRVPPKKQSSEQRNAGRTLRIAPLKKSNFHKCNNIELIQTMDKWGNNMKIIYYGIDDCEYAMITGRPAIIAAAMVSEEYLKSLDFVQLIDGRWCHFMTKAENEYYIKNSNTDPLVMDNYKISGITNEPKNYLNYHGIEYCEYEMIAGRTAIIAPEGVDEEKLKECSFIQLADGRWYHFMDEYEYNAYISGRHHFDGINQSPGNVKHYDENDIMITLGLVLLFIVGIMLLLVNYKISLIMMTASFLGLFISAMCHNSSAVKALVTLVIIIPIAFMLFVMYVINSFFSALSDCGGQSCDTAEDIGKIGAQYTYFME